MKSDNDLISASLETQKDKNITQAPFSGMELGKALRNTERFWGDCLAAPSR